MPGPFYGADTDTCGDGIEFAPESVLFDDLGQEFVWRQPRDDAGVRHLMQAAFSDPFSGFGMDGDAHWTPGLVRQWRAELPAARAAVALIRKELEMQTPASDPLRTILTKWANYLAAPDLDLDLRRYLFRLEIGEYPNAHDKLPNL